MKIASDESTAHDAVTGLSVSKDAPVLWAEELSFAYGKEPVLRGIDLSVKKGEFLGIIGQNGSGKTTLLKLMARLLSPAGGKLFLNGRDLSTMKRRKISQKVAMVAQEENAPVGFTVLEIVLMGRTPYLKGLQWETREDLEAAQRALSLADCRKFRDRYLQTLSGGEKKRVYIARALAQEPEILLMDEPTAYLDLRHQVEIMERVSELNRQGLTVVMVSHDINLASCFCTRIAALKQGKVAASGKPEDIVTPDLLEALYGCRLKVGRQEGNPLVILKREAGKQKGGG